MLIELHKDKGHKEFSSHGFKIVMATLFSMRGEGGKGNGGDTKNSGLTHFFSPVNSGVGVTGLPLDTWSV